MKNLLNRNSIYWACQIGGWLFYILIQSLFYRLINNSFDVQVGLGLLTLMLLGILTSHVYRMMIIQWNWLKLPLLQLIPRVMMATILFASLLHFLQSGAELLLGIKENINLGNNPVQLSADILNFAFIYFFWSLLYFLFHYIENYRKAEIENLKWQASINEIELNKLKSQLNPHFMFNSMNSIRALIAENPEKAKEAITQLSNILRNTLLMGKNKTIPFEEELSVVKDYLDLETTRFEERLKTTMKIHPQSVTFNVPPLMLQTLVENGIKHGISKIKEGGELNIETEVEEDLLTIKILNSGKYKEEERSETGFGLKNSRQRLALLYGESASLEIINVDNKVLTKLVIPKTLKI